MLYPEINTLMEEFDSRYSLVVAASKRARQLAAGGNCDKAVTMAIKEIAEGYVHPVFPPEYENSKKTSADINAEIEQAEPENTEPENTEPEQAE